MHPNLLQPDNYLDAHGRKRVVVHDETFERRAATATEDLCARGAALLQTVPNALLLMRSCGQSHESSDRVRRDALGYVDHT
jgi:hypothetical protein